MAFFHWRRGPTACTPTRVPRWGPRPARTDADASAAASLGRRRRMAAGADLGDCRDPPTSPASPTHLTSPASPTHLTSPASPTHLTSPGPPWPPELTGRIAI